jgi:hypothetical protein
VRGEEKKGFAPRLPIGEDIGEATAVRNNGSADLTSAFKKQSSRGLIHIEPPVRTVLGMVGRGTSPGRCVDHMLERAGPDYKAID